MQKPRLMFAMNEMQNSSKNKKKKNVNKKDMSGTQIEDPTYKN